MVACTAVNDVFVLTSWARTPRPTARSRCWPTAVRPIRQKVGLEVDLTGRGLGVRSRRFPWSYEDGVVKSLNVEEEMGVDKSRVLRRIRCAGLKGRTDHHTQDAVTGHPPRPFRADEGAFPS